MTNQCKMYARKRDSTKIKKHQAWRRKGSQQPLKIHKKRDQTEVRKALETKLYPRKSPGQPQASEDYNSKDFLRSIAEKTTNFRKWTFKETKTSTYSDTLWAPSGPVRILDTMVPFLGKPVAVPDLCPWPVPIFEDFMQKTYFGTTKSHFRSN